MSTISADSRPALPAGTRLQTDRVTGEPVLLSPEGITNLNDTAHAIVTHCDGRRTVGEIVAILAAEYDAPAEDLSEDVIACLVELREKNLLTLFVNFRPYALLAEITYRCPLHCPYCSNPTRYPAGTELLTDEWRRVIDEAAALGVLQAGFSGGEPLVRRDLAALVAHARAAGLYTNLITSGLGLDAPRAAELRAAGLDSVQISFQSDEAELADAIAGTRAHERKIAAAQAARDAGFALSANVVLHRRNIDRLPEIVTFAAALGATRLELANVQYYGWAFVNRAQLLPTREQVQAAFAVATAEQERRRGQMEIFYVLPDYFEDRPKPCMNGWGRRYITVNAIGDALPCPTASSIPGLRFENVRAHDLAWIWSESESFKKFRGEDWMQEPCRSCPERARDFGGCRCQAALLTGDAANTDPVCALSPGRKIVDDILAAAGATEPSLQWTPRENPAVRA